MGAARTFDDGIIFAMNVLAKMLGVKNFQIMAGSTADDPHVRSAMRGILDEAIATTRREAASPDWSVIGPELVEVLKFYRDGFQFVPKRGATGVGNSTWKPKSELLDDCGERARAALSRAQALKERRG